MADVFGLQFLDGARDKVVLLMEALKTTMSSGYDPTFSYVYDSHSTAKLQLNAVSVEVLEAENESIGVASGPVVEWQIAVSCRIHTAYQGERFNERDTMRLAESVANKLQTNLFTYKTDGYWIDRVISAKNQQDFESSATIGAEVIVTMKYIAEYTQE